MDKATNKSADLIKRTLETLDWDLLLGALIEHARTPMGKRALKSFIPFSHPKPIQRAFEVIEEVRALEEETSRLPVGDVGDIEGPARRAGKGEVLGKGDLRDIGRTLVALLELAEYLRKAAEKAPTLAEIGIGIALDPWLSEEIDRSFDETAELSAKTYPVLGEIRARISNLHDEIRRTLDHLVKGSTLEDVLQDRYVTVREDRYVIPIKAHAKRWDLGIVHGASGSGQTVYIEPHAVVALNNRLRLAEAELQVEERKILAYLSSRVGAHVAEITSALEAATEIDLGCAREGFARQLRAKRPQVGDQGVVKLVEARHPVLLLRQVKVVPNDLALNAEKPVLVLTGPNTGGKTVALKTIGLCALLVRFGCFIPAEDDSRMDLFSEIFALIGDSQDVTDDLSSFSGQIAALKELLARAAPGKLLLLDEIATGTDPAQGAALATAVLEALVSRGPRMVVTTHYGPLKALAKTDARFGVAAMAYEGGKPTYRMIPGATGESHAFAIAAHLGLESAILARANEVFGSSEREFSQALAALEEEKAVAMQETEKIRALRREWEEKNAALEVKEAKIKAKAKELEETAAAAFLERLKRAEKAIGEVVADLQRSPDQKRAAAARATVEAMRALIPNAEKEAVPQKPAVSLGDRVKLLDLGTEGEVVGIGDGGIQVRTGTITVRTRLGSLQILPKEQVKLPQGGFSVESQPKSLQLGNSLRMPGNTLDMRGMRVEEAMEAADRFFDASLLARYPVVFLLHGHGTGALKEAIRSWLLESEYVQEWAPASAEQGGDAYTVVALQR